MRKLALALVMVACTRTEEPVHRDPTTAKPTPSSEPTAVASAASSTTLPPIDDTCAVDDDCDDFYAYLVHGKCCKGSCSPYPAAVSYIAKVDALCQTIGYEDDDCPMKKCAAPGPLKCDHGKCVRGP
jgi:hypothetical protein